MQYNGIDVSETQGKIDWGSAESSNIKFAMIRSTYGSSGIDSQFLNNMEGISKTDICVGVYHDSEAQSVGEAVREANYFLNTVKPYKLFYPLAINIENELAMQMGMEFFTSIVNAFVSVIRENNYYPLLYGSVEVLKNIDFNSISYVDIWLKEFSSDSLQGPNYKENVAIWQYSDKGNVLGINGSVNLDISYCDYPKIIKERNLNVSNTLKNGEIYMNINNNNNGLANDMSGNTNGNINTNTNTDVNNNGSNLGTMENGVETNQNSLDNSFYTVKNGDTLRSVAEKIFGDPEKYKNLMELNGLTRPVIFAGQILRLPNSENSETFSYRVVPGDTLWKLAERFLGYGPRYNEIMSENGLTNDMIYPGQILRIKAENGNNSAPYIVKKGDTLWKIAQNTLGNGNRYTEIMKLNNLKNGDLAVGQKLIIPSN